MNNLKLKIKNSKSIKVQQKFRHSFTTKCLRLGMHSILGIQPTTKSNGNVSIPVQLVVRSMVGPNLSPVYTKTFNIG